MNEPSVSSSSSYEYVVSGLSDRQKKTRKILLLLLYIAIFVLLWLPGFFREYGWILPYPAILLYLCLSATVTLIVWKYTWKYTSVEYEYSIFSGDLTVSRILGNSALRHVCTLNVKTIDSAFPQDEAHRERVTRFSPEKTFFAASSQSSPLLYAVLYHNESDEKRMLLIDLDDRALRLLKSLNLPAVELRRTC